MSATGDRDSKRRMRDSALEAIGLRRAFREKSDAGTMHVWDIVDIQAGLVTAMNGRHHCIADGTLDYSTKSEKWYGDRSPAQVAAMIRSGGDIAGWAAAEPLAFAFDPSSAVGDVSDYDLSTGVAGGCVNVPAALMNAPDCFTTIERRNTVGARVTIRVNMTSGGKVSASDVDARARAVLGLAQAVSRVRPCRVVAFAGSGLQADRGCGFVVRRTFETPFDMSELGFFFGGAWGTRCYLLGLRQGTGWSDGAWPFRRPGDYVRSIEGCRDMNPDTEPSDVLLPALTTDDVWQFADPQEWIRGKLREFGYID